MPGRGDIAPFVTRKEPSLYVPRYVLPRSEGVAVRSVKGRGRSGRKRSVAIDAGRPSSNDLAFTGAVMEGMAFGKVVCALVASPGLYNDRLRRISAS